MITYDKLWETMDKKGITKYKLVNDYGMSKSMINRLNHNMGINTNTINNLCSILNCNVEDILTFCPDEEKA